MLFARMGKLKNARSGALFDSLAIAALNRTYGRACGKAYRLADCPRGAHFWSHLDLAPVWRSAGQGTAIADRQGTWLT